MSLEKLRYSLTEHRERIFICAYENFKLLIHPSIYENDELLDRIIDDIELMPKIEPTSDQIEIKFYKYNYNKKVFNKSEILSFIFASINNDWNITKGVDLLTKKQHFWLKNKNIVFDPSLSIITTEEIFINSKRFKQLSVIKNADIKNYLINNNNLSKFYKKKFFKIFSKKNNDDFSINFINKILEEFKKNVEHQYMLNEEKLEKLKNYFMFDNFIELRQVLTKRRKSFLKSRNIAVHPSIDLSILDEIKRISKLVCELMKKEYNIDMDYFSGTLGNCYGLSIMFNLFDENFKLVQGGIPYQHRFEFGFVSDEFYQHSWLEKDNLVYDPALRIVTFKELYYSFVQKQDEYSKEETEAILRRIGFNLTHFRDFLKGVQIGNNESFGYKYLVKETDSPKKKEEGEKLLRLVKTYNH